MALTVTFYSNFTKKENSTKQPTGTGTDLTCVLKSPTSVTAPKIEVTLTSGDPVSYTYAYIPTFHRYYFVSDWTWINGLWNASLREDVLASFKTAIGNESHYILRSASLSLDATNILTPDTFYPANHGKNTITHSLTSQQAPFNVGNACYVIGIINGGSTTGLDSQGSVKYYKITPAQVVTLISYLMSDSFAGVYLNDSSTGIEDITIKDFVNPLQFIASLRYYPFNVTASTTAERPKMGWWDTSSDTNVPSLYPVANTSEVLSETSIEVYQNPNRLTTGKEFTAFPPYISHKLKFDPWGVINLDSSLICTPYQNVTRKVYMNISIDYVTGLGRLDLDNASNHGWALGSYIAQVGIDIELAQVTQDIISANYGKFMSTGAKIVDWIDSKLGTNLVEKYQKTFNIGSGVVSAFGLAGKIDMSRAGSNGSLLSYKGFIGTPSIVTEWFDCVPVDLAEFGRAICQVKKINTLSGYILCGEVDTDAGDYIDEKQEITAFLRGGFFYE